MDETADECARRELKEETGLETDFIEQFHTFSGIGRDPRERVVTIAYFALVNKTEVRGGDDAKEARWFPIDQLPELAFDHAEILAAAHQSLKEKIHFEPVGFELLPEVFTMDDVNKSFGYTNVNSTNSKIRRLVADGLIKRITTGENKDKYQKTNRLA